MPGLISPHPLADGLPSLLRADPFLQAYCAGLDEVLAPVLSTLDNVEALLDVGTAPADLLPWLCRWAGLDAGHEWRLAEDRLRSLIAVAPELHARRGTGTGIRLALAAVFDVTVEITESGATTWSERADVPLPGQRGPTVSVTVTEPRSGRLDRDRCEAFVRSLTPVHVDLRVEFLPAEPPPLAPAPPASAPPP